MSTVEVFVPCTTVEVQVKLGPADALTPIEMSVIEAVSVGVTRFSELIAMFSLGPRVMLDLVFDLWRGGYLMVDPLGGMVDLTATTADDLASGKLHEVSGVRREETRTLMQEQLAGHLLSSRHHQRGELGPRTIVPLERGRVTLEQLRDSDVTRAIVDDLRRDRERDGEAGGAQLKVLSARVSARSLQGAGGNFWLPITVRARVVADEQPRDDGLPEPLRVEVLSETLLPYAVREEMARRLEALVETRPFEAFTEHLRGNAALALSGEVDVDEQAAQLRSRVASLASAEPDAVAARHEALLERATRLEAAMIGSRDPSIAITVISGREAHEELLLEMLDGAQRQLVVSSTWIAGARLMELLEPLAEALAKGTQIVLLWGMGERDEALPPDVQQHLQRLHTRFPARLFFASESARTHAKLAIQDDCRAVVTSANLLSGGSGALELGFELRARPRSHRRRSIEQLLNWARGQYPVYGAAQGMYSLAEDFEHDREALAREDDLGMPVRPPDAPAGQAAGGLLASADTELWRQAWERYVVDLEKAYATARGPRVRLVTDAQHRRLLGEALSAARQRLVVASDQLSEDVVDARFLRQLEGRLAEENSSLEVTLVYQRAGARGGAEAEAALTELEKRHSGRLRVVCAKSHAKALVCDDRVIVTSFNFLSFAGLYERNALGKVVRRQRTELGVQLDDAATADAVADALAAVVPGGLVAPSRTERARVPPALEVVANGVTATTLAEARAVLADVARDGDAAGPGMVQAMRASADPGALLDHLASLGLEVALLRPGIAAALHDELLEGAAKDRWLDALISDRIAADDMVAAAILRSCAGEESTAPATAVLTLAGSLGGDTFGQAADDALSLSAADDEWASVAILGALRVIDGDPDALAVVDLAHESATGPWRAMIDALHGFYTAFYRPFPWRELASHEAARSSRQALTDAWADLDEALRAAEEKRVTPPWAQDVRRLVHAADEPFGTLRAYVDERDRAGVEAWWEAYGRQSLERLIDDAARRATGGRERLHHALREGYLNQLRAIVRRARALAQNDARDTESLDPDVLAAGSEVLVELRALRGALEREADTAPERIRPIMHFALRRLEPMLVEA